MNFKVFKQEGKEVIINLDLITHIIIDSSSKKVCLLGSTKASTCFYVDDSIEDVKKMLKLTKPNANVWV